MTNPILPLSLLIAVLSALLILPLVRYFYVRPLDEGFYAYPAYLIYKGESPYRDFYLGYTPGKTCLLAFLFKLFGPTLVTARYYYSAVTILLSFEVVWLTHLILPGVIPASVAGILFILSLFPRRELYYVTALETGMFSDRTAVAVLLMITAITANNLQSVPLFFLSGILIVLTLFFAQEAGIWAFVSLSLYSVSAPPDSLPVYGTAFFFGAALSGILISALALKAGIPFKRFFNECFKEIIVLGTGNCRRPYPSLFSVLPDRLSFSGLRGFKKERLHFFIHYCRYYTPLFFFSTALFFIIPDLYRGDAQVTEMGVILPLIYGVFASFFTYSWPDYSHVARGAPVHIPVALFTLFRMYEKVSESTWQTISFHNIFYIYVLTLFCGLFLYDVFYGIQAWILEIRERTEKIALEGNSGIFLKKREHKKISSLLEKMRKEVRADEKVFAIPADPLISFLMQKRTKVYLKSFLPFNPLHYHSQAVSVLKTGDVEWVIYNRDQDRDDFFPKRAKFAGFAPSLHRYIQQEYSKIFELDGYDVYKKN